MSPENLAIIRAAATPLPETSPTRDGDAVPRQGDKIVIIAAHFVGRVVMGEEFESGDRPAPTGARTASEPARPA